MCPGIPVGDTFWINDIQFYKVDNDSLPTIVGGSSNELNVCTTGVTDMASLFRRAKKFNKDISSWDTSSVTDMNGMFVVRVPPPRVLLLL